MATSAPNSDIRILLELIGGRNDIIHNFEAQDITAGLISCSIWCTTDSTWLNNVRKAATSSFSL